MERRTEKQITVRIDHDAGAWLGTIADSPTSGATTVLEAAPTLYRQALAEVRGLFSEQECKLILDALNGVYLAGGLAGQHLAVEIHDAIGLNGLNRKWGIDAEKIDRTIGGLTSYQRTAIELWSAAFWSGEYNNAEFERHHLALLTGG